MNQPRPLYIAFLIGLACLLLAPRTAFAWGDSGHRIVAQVGEDRLSANAQAAIRKLAGSKGLALLATWPDFIRSEPAWDFAKPWHFLTVEDDQEISDVLGGGSPSDTPRNVVEGIEFFSAVLRGDATRTSAFAALLKANKAQPLGGSIELTALAFLVHFVGDVHQPLHVGRGGDRGGNSVSVNWFGEVKNLHSVWDEGLIESENLSYSEFVRFLEQELAAEIEVAQDSKAEDWAEESIGYRQQVYEIWSQTSRTNYLPDLGYNYAHDHIAQIRLRLYKGGLRLAARLNAIFP
jgi:hypothetical protein